MSLDFADFAHYYAGSNMDEAEQRQNFEIYASILESLVQFFWDEDQTENRLGISFDLATISSDQNLESDQPFKTTFNCAACVKAARKTDS